VYSPGVWRRSATYRPWNVNTATPPGVKACRKARRNRALPDREPRARLCAQCLGTELDGLVVDVARGYRRVGVGGGEGAHNSSVTTAKVEDPRRRRRARGGTSKVDLVEREGAHREVPVRIRGLVHRVGRSDRLLNVVHRAILSAAYLRASTKRLPPSRLSSSTISGCSDAVSRYAQRVTRRKPAR